jgi:hypothetical protein
MLLRKRLQQIILIRNASRFTRNLSVAQTCSNPSIGAFRTLLRAVKETFRSDEIAVKRCRDEARRQFVLNSNESDQEKIKALVAEAFDAALFLKESVIQAKLNKSGIYEMKVGETGGKDDVIRVQEATSAAADGDRTIAARANTSTNVGCGRPDGCGCANGS